MTDSNTNVYDNMPNYIESIFNVFQSVTKRATLQKDKRLKTVSLIILNYVKKMANDFKIELKNIVEPESINLIPIFEYISFNNIQLYDFSTIDMADVDTSKNADLERFVLTHIYYITQLKNK